MLTSLELGDVLKTDFATARTWYLERLQPRYWNLRDDMSRMSAVIYDELADSSRNYDMGFYRSIIPSIVALGVVILLVFLLLFFILFFYVNPLYKMMDGLKSYREYNKNYVNHFDGDDQLSELNKDISDLVQENRQLRERIRGLRQEAGKQTLQ